MKPLAVLFIFATMMCVIRVRGQEISNSGQLSKTLSEDTERLLHLIQLQDSYFFKKPDTSLLFSTLTIEQARKMHFPKAEYQALDDAARALRIMGDYPKALEMQYRALEICKNIKDKAGEAITMGMIGITYSDLNEYRQALDWLYTAYKMEDSFSEFEMAAISLSNIGNTYEKMNMLDSALIIQQQARELSVKLDMMNLKSRTFTRIGIVLSRLGRYHEALNYFRDAFIQTKLSRNKLQQSEIQFGMANAYLNLTMHDSSLYHARLAYSEAKNQSQKLELLEASSLLIKIFRLNDLKDSVIYYQDNAIAMKDSLFGWEKLRQYQLFSLKQQQQQHKLNIEAKNSEIAFGKLEVVSQRKTQIGLIIGLALLGMIGGLLFWQNRIRKKSNNALTALNNQLDESNTLLTRAKELTEDQRDETNKALEKLKRAQAHLIQSEKLASLGQLTAGIAHEIQNPLNFVTNFSEVNTELIADLQEANRNKDTSEVQAISEKIFSNETKISHHGKRADAIVKGMLQHSRSGDLEQKLTDINALVDEYFQLAYQGLRAKDKTFNVTMNKDFDPEAGMINIMPQELGRVILNIVNNAFYAESAKSKEAPGDYSPAVSVSTKKTDNQLFIVVKDDGTGIAPGIKEKIFHPFFTTKGPGIGTGLGLSLSYDIVKAHGGEIRVESEEGVGTEFIIILPAEKGEERALGPLKSS